MATTPTRWPLTRRQFFSRGSVAAGLISLAASAAQGQTSAKEKANPFAYDVSRLTQTDPKLVQYTQVRRIASPRENARRISIGPDDALYLTAGNYVNVLDGQGILLNEIALGSAARCLAISPEGVLFAGFQTHVELFDRKGQRTATWASPGPRTWLTSLAVTGDNVFLADAGNRIIHRCDRSGKIVGRIGAKDKDRNVPGFIIPSPFFDVEMHPDGLLRASNPGRHRVEVYTVDGDLEFAWGRPSNKIEGFCGCCNPINIARLPDGRTVTCEKGLPRVKVYRANGEFECVVAGPESFPENARSSTRARLPDGTPSGGLDVAVDSTGRIYVLDLVQGDILVMERKADEPVAQATQPKTPA